MRHKTEKVALQLVCAPNLAAKQLLTSSGLGSATATFV